MADDKTPPKGTMMKGKRGLVLGIATERSIAYGIAQVMAAQGAELAVSYQVDQLARRVTSLAEGLGAGIIQLADAQNEAQLDQLFATIKEKWGGLDFLIHSHRLFRSHRAGRRLRQHHACQLPEYDGYFLLYVHRSGAPVGRPDEQRRQHDHPHLHGGRARAAAL